MEFRTSLLAIFSQLVVMVAPAADIQAGGGHIMRVLYIILQSFEVGLVLKVKQQAYFC